MESNVGLRSGEPEAAPWQEVREIAKVLLWAAASTLSLALMFYAACWLYFRPAIRQWDRDHVEKIQLLSSPYLLGRAAGACEIVGRLDSEAYAGSYDVLSGDTSMRSILGSEAFESLVRDAASDYERGVKNGLALRTSGTGRASRAWHVCTEGHQYLSEWQTDAALAKESVANRIADDKAVEAPITTQRR